MASVGKMRAEGGTFPPFPQLPELAVSVTARIEGRLTGIERVEQVRDRANWKRDIDEKSLVGAQTAWAQIYPLSSMTLGNFPMLEFPHPKKGTSSSFLMKLL